MVQAKDLTELRLKDFWDEVKDEDKWWGGFETGDTEGSEGCSGDKHGSGD
jgi:hypothetical protein